MLTIKLKEMAGTLDAAHKKFMLTGGVSLGDAMPDNPTDWVLEKQWGELNRLAKLKSFDGLVEHFLENHAGFFRNWYDSSSPQDFEMCEKWQHLDKFEHLCL